jgi:DNA-binding LacI/PurR family transcriptional regulator
MSEPRPITLKEIAARAGLSIGATSYALRNDPQVSAATAARVQHLAKRLGYRPNPRVSALMSHIRQAKPVSVGERIAFLWIDVPPEQRPYPVFLKAAKDRATQLGYTVEEFWLRTPGQSAKRLEQILFSRGIAGVLISPCTLPNPTFRIDWNWSLFSPAIIGTAECVPELHHSAHHHFGGMRTAMLHLQGKKRKRIAGLLDFRIEDRVRRAWSSSFLIHHPLQNRGWNFLNWGEERSPGKLATWLRHLKPDAIISTRDNFEKLLKGGWRLSRKIETVLLDSVLNPWGLASIDQGEAVIAANAVDLVAGQLHRNERGAPGQVKMLLHVGTLASGKSTRSRR